MHPKLDEPKIKWIGGCVLALLVGVAIGNGHATNEALKGSSQWWQQQKHLAVTAQSRQDWSRCMKDYGE